MYRRTLDRRRTARITIDRDMLVPIRCFTCGKVIADKWKAYERELKKLNAGRDARVGEPAERYDESSPSRSVLSELTCARDVKHRAPAGQILDQLGITKLCCRRHFLTTVDLMDTM